MKKSSLKQSFLPAYTIYAKGLAFYHEGQLEDSIENFERARELDTSPDMERADIMKFKAQMKINEIKRSVKLTPVATTFKQSPGSSSGGGIARRFGCEICNHFFGKKFNLDRHNRSIHKRDTPENFLISPIPMEQEQEKPPVKSESFGESPINIHFNTEQSSPEPFESPKKKQSKPNPLSALGVKSRVKCNICKKMFKRGSFKRHLIIHSGKKHHECQTCQRSFFQKSDLLRHEVKRASQATFISFLTIFLLSLLGNTQ
jgi:Zinc finger, C2H2 type